jgi:hypothetical protein
MSEELEKTCENCEYENEDMESTHCRHCIHNAEEHFAPKINHEKEIRNKAIDDFVKLFIEEDSKHILDYNYYETIREVAQQLKGEKQ